MGRPIIIYTKQNFKYILFHFQFIVELVADCKKGLLSIKLIGANACKAGNTILKSKNESTQLEHGEIIELLEKQYPFRVEFSPDPTKILSSDSSSSSTEEVMVGKQTTLNNFLITKRKSTSDENALDPNHFAKKSKMENSWEEIDGGKLILFTSDPGAQHKSKVFHSYQAYINWNQLFYVS